MALADTQVSTKLNQNNNQREAAIAAGKSLTSSELNQADRYVKLVNNKYVLDVPENSGLSNETINKVKMMLNYFNTEVENAGIIIDLKNQTGEFQSYNSPFISFARKTTKHHRKHHKSSHISIVGYDSNGYCYRDSRGNYHYVVTKSPLQTVLDVSRKGWEAALGGGWVGAPENANWHGFKYNR